MEIKEENRRTRSFILCLLLAIFVIIAIFHFGTINKELNGVGGDNAHYILLAKSIATGNGYKSPGTNPHTHFPPGFPLLLMPVYLLFGVNFAAFHTLVVLSEITALLLIFFLIKKLWGILPAVIVCLIFAFNPFVYHSLVRILTEYPYLMVSAGALLMAERARHRVDDKGTDYVWLPLLVTAAYFIRLAGLSLFFSFVLYRLFQRRFKTLLLNLPLVLVLPFAWKIRTTMVGVEAGNISKVFMRDSYDPSKGYATVSDLVLRVWGNLRGINEGLAHFLYPNLLKPGVLIMILTAFLALVGLVTALRKNGFSLINIYIPIYLGMLLLWPFYDQRKLLPVVPFLFYYFFLGLERIVDLGQARFSAGSGQKRLAWSLAALLMTGVIIFSGQFPETMRIRKFQSRPFFYPSPTSSAYEGFSMDWSHFFGAYYWQQAGTLEKNIRPWTDFLYVSKACGHLTPPGSKILSRKASLTALFSGQPASCYPFYRDSERQKSLIMREKIDYILLDGMFRDTGRYLIPYLKANNKALTGIMKSGNALLLKVDRERL